MAMLEKWSSQCWNVLYRFIGRVEGHRDFHSWFDNHPPSPVSDHTFSPGSILHTKSLHRSVVILTGTSSNRWRDERIQYVTSGVTHWLLVTVEHVHRISFYPLWEFHFIHCHINKLSTDNSFETLTQGPWNLGSGYTTVGGRRDAGSADSVSDWGEHLRTTGLGPRTTLNLKYVRNSLGYMAY